MTSDKVVVFYEMKSCSCSKCMSKYPVGIHPSHEQAANAIAYVQEEFKRLKSIDRMMNGEETYKEIGRIFDAVGWCVGACPGWANYDTIHFVMEHVPYVAELSNLLSDADKRVLKQRIDNCKTKDQVRQIVCGGLDAGAKQDY